jgi:hypothetical protein
MPEVLQRRTAQGDTIELLGSAPLLLKGLYSQKQLEEASAAGYRTGEALPGKRER